MLDYEIEVVNWAEAKPAIRSVREAVFMRERGEPVGTARLTRDGRLGRMAVYKKWRGRGVGRALLQRVLTIAVEQGLPRVSLAAQTHAIGFYEQAGFRVIGEPFLDAGIPHRRMILGLCRDPPDVQHGED